MCYLKFIIAFKLFNCLESTILQSFSDDVILLRGFMFFRVTTTFFCNNLLFKFGFFLQIYFYFIYLFKEQIMLIN